MVLGYNDKMSRKGTLTLLLLICLVGAGLRAYHLTARSLWFDEAFSWRLIQFPWTEMIARDAADVHPPLYYIFLKVWAMVFGSSVLSLRAFSVTAATLAIGAIYLLAKEIWRSERAGLVAAFLLAVSGFQIQAAWEARMYTLGTLFIVIAAWLLLRALKARQQAWLWWIGFALATVAAVYTHYYLLFSLIGLVVFLLGYFIAVTRGRIGEILQWSHFWYAVIAGGLIAAIFGPWLPTFFQQTKQVQASFWIPPFDWRGLPDTFYHFFIPTVGGLSHEGLGHLTWVYLPLLIVGAIWLWLITTSKGQERTGRWLVFVMGTMPLVISIGFSLLGRSIFQERYLIFAQIFILVALAGAWERLRWPWVRRILIVLVIAGLVSADWFYWQGLHILDKPGAHAATQYVLAHQQPPEPVLVSSPFIYFAVLHYTVEEAPTLPQPHLYSETGELAHFAGGPILKSEDVMNSSLWQDPNLRSFWVVDTTGFGGSSLPVPHGWQATDQRSFPEVHDYQGYVTVTHYQRP